MKVLFARPTILERRRATGQSRIARLACLRVHGIRLWDVKHIQRLIVTSAAFRQASRLRPEQTTVDPENRLLSRGPRYRVDAEMIRDSALAASGLFVEKLGGPSAKPYQPSGLWRDVAYGGGGLRYTAQEYIQDHGDNLYRRSMYTFWKRASAPPGMLLFDAPNRRSALLREAVVYAVQALALMNDIQYIEAARAVAERIMQHGGSTTPERITYAGLLTLWLSANACGSQRIAPTVQ